MPNTLKKFLYSRKFWAFLAGMVTLVGASLEDGSFSTGEIQTLAATIIGYIGSVAVEDGLSNFNAPKRDAPAAPLELSNLTADEIEQIWREKVFAEGMKKP